MKKILILLFSLGLLLFPYYLKADIKPDNLKEALKKEDIEPLFDKLYKDNEDQAVVYFFRGQGESKSIDFLNYLNSIYEEYGEFFRVVIYEVGENPDNSKLMDNVIEYLSANVTTVPFIVIDDAYFITYDESVNENILKTIVQSYQSTNKTDKVGEVLVKYYRNYDFMIVSILISVSLFIGFMIYAGREGK